VNKQGNLSRSLSFRHIQFIALGSAIGTGLFYGSSEAIRLSGPSVLFSYLISGIFIYFVMCCIGTMVLKNQNISDSGSFEYYSHKYINQTAGFMTGWMYVFEIAIVSIADITAVSIYMGFWYPNIDRTVWIALVIFVVGTINLIHVRIFGEVEFWLTVIKIISIIVMILGGGYLLLFANPINMSSGIQNLWIHNGFMPNGIYGFLESFCVVIFAFGGIEIIGITASEAKNPEISVHKAIHTIPIRIIVFYVLTIFIIITLQPWNQIDGNSSPFVQIFDSIGIKYAANILNLVVVSASISAINSDIFGSGRVMYNLGKIGNAPKIFTKISKNGIPWVAVIIMLCVLLFGLLLNYLIPDGLFFMIASTASFATIFVWIMILLSYLSMKYKDSNSNLDSKFHFFNPISAVLALIFLLSILILMGYFKATRISLILGISLIIVLYLINKFRKYNTIRC